MYSLKIKGLALLTAIISTPTMSAQFQVKLADLDHGRIRVAPALPADGVVAPDTELTITAIPEPGQLPVWGQCPE